MTTTSVGMTCGDPNNPSGPYLRANGKPCKNRVIPGTSRCALHGGMSPAALIKAQSMLALMRMPALEVMWHALEALDKTIEQFLDDTCATCGYPRGDVEEKEALIKACRSAAMNASQILDRTGMGPTATLEIKQSDGAFPLGQCTIAEKAEFLRIAAEFKSLKKQVLERVAGIDPNAPAQPSTIH